MATAVSPGCAIFTHEFKGAASRVPAEATAFGLRRDHVLVEILAAFVDRSDQLEEQRHRQWARAARAAFDPMALPGGYPNLLAGGDADRAAKSYGRNAERLIEAKRHYDPDNVFRSAIPLPIGQDDGPRSLARFDPGQVGSAGGLEMLDPVEAQAALWPRPKTFVCAAVAVMAAYVLYRNERFLVDPAHPVCAAL